jgi:hypothetical protein
MNIGKEMARYEIQFTFGGCEALIVDRSSNRSMKVQLEKPVTEENYRKEFKALAEALRHSGNAREGDGISCVTFPAASRQVAVTGHAR